jgi:hypothetical protein
MTARKTEGTKTRSTGYVHPYKHYADLFSETDRTIKRWIKQGRESDDPPPLDDAGAMADWWSRHKKQRVPEKLLQLARSAGLGDGDSAVADDPLFNQPVEQAAPVPDDLAVGLGASVERLRRAEAVANHAYTEAVRLQRDDGEIERKQRAWERVSGQLRQSEKSLRELEGKYGQMFSEAEIRRELAEIHLPVYVGIKNFFRKMFPRLESLESVEDREALWNAEARKLFRGMNDSRFVGEGFDLSDG